MAPTMNSDAIPRRIRFEPFLGRPGMGGRGLRERLASFALGSTSPRRGMDGVSGVSDGSVCSRGVRFSGCAGFVG